MTWNAGCQWFKQRKKEWVRYWGSVMKRKDLRKCHMEI